MIVVLWIALAFVVGYVASKRGRNTVGFFFLSLILSPLVGFLVLIALPDLSSAETPTQPHFLDKVVGPSPQKTSKSESGYIMCPSCGRPTREDKPNCRQCGAEIKIPEPMQTADTKVCPFCAETIKAAAIKCKHCGSDLGAEAVAKTS